MVNTMHLLKPEANMPYHVGVVGGSLAGLAAANILHRLGHSVQVYEKYPASLETRGSSLGYVDNALWEYVRGASMMRMGRRAHRSQGAYYYGDLWRFLYDGLPPDTVRFGVTVSDLGPSPTAQPTINGEMFDAVIIADGGFSSLRHYVNDDAQQPEYAGQVVFEPRWIVAIFRTSRMKVATCARLVHAVCATSVPSAPESAAMARACTRQGQDHPATVV